MPRISIPLCRSLACKDPTVVSLAGKPLSMYISPVIPTIPLHCLRFYFVCMGALPLGISEYYMVAYCLLDPLELELKRLRATT